MRLVSHADYGNEGAPLRYPFIAAIATLPRRLKPGLILPCEDRIDIPC
jgi:hypothetical protein